MICTAHTKSYYELNKHTRTLITSSPNTITLSIHQHDNLTIDINTLTLKTHHRFFLTSITQINIFCPLNKVQNVDESRPLIAPHQFLQPVEFPILEFIFNTRYNHKLYNLIQNTPYEQSSNTEEHNIFKAFELPWRFLQHKHIIRLLANLLTSSDIIHNIFPHGFFTDD